MRPTDDISRALLFAACALHTPLRSATLADITAHSGVGSTVARVRVSNLHRAGYLAIARTRRVAYRNRPVAEYAPAMFG